MFTETTIYENINRIVKMLNYNPVGYQTSNLSFNAFASEDLVPGTYTIPRYSFINSNDTYFSTDIDISFTKNTPSDESIPVIGQKHLLYQGKWIELPGQQSTGQDFETVFVSTIEPGAKVDHFHVHVYVKDISSGKYYRYEETTSLYLHGPTERVFEKRFNENEIYEVKFGDNVTGARLTPGDEVLVYYLESSGEAGQVGADFLNDTSLTLFGTNTFNTLKNDIKPENVKYITFDNIETLSFSNSQPSTMPQARESVDEIKRKAPLHLSSQDRLVTLPEYKTHIEKNFGKLLASSDVVDNLTYMDGHMKYLSEDIGVQYPNLESRVMYNHLNVATSTHFNNIYIYCVPKMSTNTSSTVMTNFLSPASKELILNDISKKRMVSHEIVLTDPVYVAVNLGVTTSTETLTTSVTDNTQLIVKKSNGSLRDDDAIIQEVTDTIAAYFMNTDMSLGQLIDVNTLGSTILGIGGVESIETSRTDISLTVPGISLSIWNPVYPGDITVTNQNIKLPYFKFAYLHDAFNLFKKVVIID
tara:strand:+ start:2200 stop:3789 length:1590 start_codon:yes stop_codon:yes gene_type:complete